MLKSVLTTLALSFSLFTSTLALASAATDVQLVIDGRTYYCSPNGYPGPGPGNSSIQCANTVRAIEKQFAACKAAGNYSADCFKQVYASRPYECGNQDSQWSESCNTSCKSAGNYSADCYKKCY